MLYYTILYYTILYYTVLYSTLLYSTVLYYIILLSDWWNTVERMLLGTADSLKPCLFPEQ